MLRKRMRALSDCLDFERAARVRDYIHAIESTLEPQKVASHSMFDRDVIAIEKKDGRWIAAFLFYRSGALEDSSFFFFPGFKGNPEELAGSVIGQFYDDTKFVPPEILLSHKPNDADVLHEFLESLRGRSVRMRVPQRGEKAAMLTLARDNARQQLATRLARVQTRQETIDSLQKSLHLSVAPHHIECFDISNISGMMAVGAMVSFKDGEPDRANYRRYKVKTVSSSDDYAMMKEVLHRRLRRVLAEGLPLPDLILVDGGKGQLNIAIEVVEELGVRVAGRSENRNGKTSAAPRLTEAVSSLPAASIHLAAIAKEHLEPTPSRNARTRRSKASEGEKIYLPNRKNPIVFAKGSPALHLLQRIRNEAHRFAISFHKTLRKKTHLRSVLDALPGFGPKRKKALLAHFGSLARLRNATAPEIAVVKGISPSLAQSVQTLLNNKA